MPSIPEVSSSFPCPVCGKPDYCRVQRDDNSEVEFVLCFRTPEAETPPGWQFKLSQKGNPIFTPEGKKKRRYMPNFSSLITTEKSDIPQWERPPQKPLDQLQPGDLVVIGTSPKLIKQFKKRLTSAGKGKGSKLLVTDPGYENNGKQEFLESDIKLIAHDDVKAKEVEITYLYTRADDAPVGKVVRRQWSDRRKVYLAGGHYRNKQVRPYHWDSSKKAWTLGKGPNPWPLYRESEVMEVISGGGVVFWVGGEKCVETYRRLGLTATCNAQGESNWREAATTLHEWVIAAKREGHNPLIVLHPDYDLTGKNQFKKLHDELREHKISSVCLSPVALWPDCPHGGDIADWLASGVTPAGIIATLESHIQERLDHEERWTNGRYQLEAWNPPKAHRGELGYWNHDKTTDTYHFNALADFDFSIERELSSPDGGGLLLRIKRADDKRPCRAFLESGAFDSAQRFSASLKKALGGAVATRMGNNTVQALLRAKLHYYRHEQEGKCYRMVTRSAQQDDGVWVFPTFQLDRHGNPTTEDQSLWCWYTSLVQGESLLPVPKITQPNPQILGQLLQVMAQAFGPENIHHAVLTLGYAAAAVNRQAIMAHDGCFPIFSLYGDPGSGKTTMAECALAVVGMSEQGMFSQISIPAMFEKLKLVGALLYCLDDPQRDPEMDETLKRLYNGEPRVVKGKDNEGFNQQKPHSALMLTSNSALGEHSQAARSRMIRLFVGKRTDGDRMAFVELRKLCRQAGGALPTLIQFGHNPQAISQLEEKFRPLMIHAQGRLPKSLALITHYAKLICQAGDLNIDIERWVVNNVCPEFNDVDEGGDSLRDFFEKLAALRSEAAIGGWNYRYVQQHGSEDIQGLAIYLNSVWPVMDQKFSLPYNKKIIRKLLRDEGASIESVQRFHEDKDISLVLSRAGQKENIPMQPRKCILVPVDVLRKFSEMGVTGVTQVTCEDENRESHDIQESGELPIFISNRVTKDIDTVTPVLPTNGHGQVTFFDPQSYPHKVTDRVTAETHAEQGLDDSSYRVTLDTPKNGCEKNQDQNHWQRYPEGEKPQEGDKVRIATDDTTGRIAGLRGEVGTVARVHAVQVQVRLGDGISTLANFKDLEVWRG